MSESLVTSNISEICAGSPESTPCAFIDLLVSNAKAETSSEISTMTSTLDAEASAVFSLLASADSSSQKVFESEGL